MVEGIIMKTRIVFAAMAGLLLASSTYSQQSTNSFVGIGMMLGSIGSNQTITIEGTVPNSPAAVAGLKQGEILARIDGTPTAGMNLKQCVDMMHGPTATTVTLEILDPKDNTTQIVTLTRETLAIPQANNTAPSTPPAPAPGP
jgi:C-terminal processing protease CtpA/Prc